MTEPQYKRFHKEWMKEQAVSLVSECGMTKKDAKVQAEYDFEKYIGQAGDEARDEHIMHMREIEMKIETKTTTSTNDSLSVSHRLFSIGQELMIDWEKREIKAQRDFTKDIKVGDCKANNGFDVRLGELMVELRSDLAEGERVSSKVIKAVGIDSIPSPRRSEAFRLVTEREAIDAFLKETGKKFTSLSALFRDMDKQAKLDDTASEAEEAEEAEESAPITLDMIVANFITTVTANGFSVEEAMDTMIGHLSGDHTEEGEAA